MANIVRLSFGNRLRRGRLDRGQSLRQVARDAGITASYLSDIENDRRVPAETVIRRLAILLQLDFDALMALAGRLGGNTERYIREVPAAGALIRRLSETNLGLADLAKLSDLIDDLQRNKVASRRGAGDRLRHA